MAELITAKGVPYVDGNDLLTAWPGRSLDLANWVDARPGVAIVTTVQRDALVAPDLWTGKVVYNTTNGRLESYNGAHWQGVTDVDVVTDAQRDAFGVSDTWTGHVIWNSTSNSLQVYTGAAWSQVGGSVQTMTTTARTALAGDDLWTGRMIFDTTLSQLFVYNGAAWVSAGVALDTTAGDITAITRGAAAAAGAIGKGADAGHTHPYADTDTTIDSVHAMRFRIDQRQIASLTFTSGNLTQVVEKDSTGATTMRTINLTYTSGNLTSVAEIANGHTATTTLTYTFGVLSSVTRSYV